MQETSHSKKIKGKYYKCICILMIGVAAFILIYGIKPLNVTNDSWILSGYDESDIIQHYSGWLAFRNSPWRFPLGLAENLAVGDGTYITYTDSIPYVAIFFKSIRGLLPKTFQYFGIYTLFCYIMQAYASFSIVHNRTKDFLYSSICSIIFVFSPILMERAFRHTSLGSQWLLLLAIKTYLDHKRQAKNMDYLKYGLLLVLAIGIHPYFLPMISIFMIVNCISDVLSRNKRAIVFVVCSFCVTLLFGYLIGAIGSGVSTSRWGYGYLSMNINAIINPTSLGGYTWSAFFKQRPQILGNYDGFNYIGAGVLAGVAFVLLNKYLFNCQKEELKTIKNHCFLIVACIFCILFAITNQITLDDKIILKFPIAPKIQDLFGIFRASSRMFYPVYYLVYIWMLFALYEMKEKFGLHKIRVLCLLIVLIQLADLHSCIIQKHQYMIQKNNEISILDNMPMSEIAKEKEYLLVEQFYGERRITAVWALKNQMKIYFSTANSGDYSYTQYLNDELLQKIHSGEITEDYVIATDVKENADAYLANERYCCYKYDGIYYIYEK